MATLQLSKVGVLAQVLLLAVFQVVNSRTIIKPRVVTKFRSQSYKDLANDTVQVKDLLQKNSDRESAKDHLNSVMPESLALIARDGRALNDHESSATEGDDNTPRRECNGTTSKLNTRSDVRKRYLFYKRRYQGCEVVNGNLEIVFLYDLSIDYDMSFLKDIREVTGYVLITFVLAKTIPLTSLELIRGETLYKGNSLYVALNYYPSYTNIVGLYELQMPSLVEITRGDVVFRRNNYLCFMDTIVWGTIMKQTDSRLYRRQNRRGIVRACGSCAYSCHDHCWGEADDMCQANPDYYYYY